MLAQMGDHEKLSAIDKNLWTDMLRVAGLDDRAMAIWHQEFEKRAPEAHMEFLLSLGLSEAEALRIRQWAGEINPRVQKEKLGMKSHKFP